MRPLFLKLISLVLVFSVLTSLAGCGVQGPESPSKDNSVDANNDWLTDESTPDGEDVFYEIEFSEIVFNEIDVVELDVSEILVNCIEVNGIDNLEVEVVAINDSMITLAHENFVSYYGVDFDLGQFLKDMAIGGTVVLVYVTLSTVGGPVGTFFGAVIISEVSASAVLIGAAIDAAVAGYKAYQEGGDASYIVGHMLNGMADGFKWSAMLAPVTGSFAGIKALKATTALKSVIKDISEDSARALLKNFAKIIRNSVDLSDLTDDTIKQLYKQLASELPPEITEEIFIQAIKNKSSIAAIIRQFNPFNVATDVTRALQQEFWGKAAYSQITESAGKNIINSIKNGTIKSLADIPDESIRAYIRSNMYAFVQCYGNSLSKDFVDNCLKESMGDTAYATLKSVITSNDGYIKLIRTIDIDTVNQILEKPEDLILLSLRFGSDNVSKLRQVKQMYAILSRNIAHSYCRFFLGCCCNMSIGIQGEAGGEVAEDGGDRLDVHAVLQGDGSEGVAEVVEPHLGDASSGEDSFQHIIHAIRRDGTACGG